MRTIFFGLVLLLAALVITTSSSTAAAQDRHPTYVGFGLGPTIGLGGGGVAFKLEQSLGHHIVDVGDHPGLFVGGVLAEAFAGGSTVLQMGARVGFDAQVFSNRKLALLVTPHVTLGAGVSIVDLGDGKQASGAFDMGFAGELRLVVADERATVWVRPVGIDLMIRSGVGASYDLLVGASYNF